jgi:hypothetical protein
MSTTEVAEITSAPSLRDKLLWLSLSACGSMLLLSITNHITENVAPVPLFWVLPLALYLLTFTLAFQRRSFYSRWLMARLLGVTLGSLGYAIYDPSYTESIQVSVPLFCGGLFVCCLFCHGELAKRRPAPRNLTTFYLTISLGGALGAIFVGLLAPYLFAALYEFPLTLCLTALVAAIALWPEGWLERIFWSALTVIMAAVLGYNVHSYKKNDILTVRNFYGGLRVKQLHDWLKQPYRELYHGKIEHGAQFLNPPKSLLATTYYSADSGVGVALRRFSGAPKRVGVIGLGAGTLAAYGNASDYFRFSAGRLHREELVQLSARYARQGRYRDGRRPLILGRGTLAAIRRAGRRCVLRRCHSRPSSDQGSFRAVSPSSEARRDSRGAHVEYVPRPCPRRPVACR